MSRARRLTALLLISLAARAASVSAATLFDPALRFRVLATEHFRIYFHQGEDRLARRLALIAEETWTALRQPLGATPPRLTHVVIADQTELANGYAIPLPRDTVVITAAWPAGVEFIGTIDDWLRMVFTHEFTHIVHLDRSEGLFRAVRNVLGRSPFAFPNLYLPTWQIEGLATYEESAITGKGRLHGGDFAAIVGEEARQHQVQSLDRINGGLTDWPSGLAPYAYGLGFHKYLVDRFGSESLGRLADATSRRVPYFTLGAFDRVFGESLRTLWADFDLTLRRTVQPAGPADAGLTRVTRHGFIAEGPRFDRFDKGSIVYAARTPNAFPALHRVRIDTGTVERIATRYFGSTSAIGADTLYFDQYEIRRNVGIYSDLYALSRSSGDVERLTDEARLIEPDLSPDGTTLVCVQQKPSQRDLVLVSVKPRTAAVTTLITEPETQFNAPRWSPDGRTIAAERHRVGGLSEIVLVDVATKTVRSLAWTRDTRMTTPAWRPDGRALVVAAAPEEEPFNLYEFSLDGPASPRQLTHVTGGATWPDVSADGSTLAFVGYTVAGFDIFTEPYPPAAAIADSGAPPSEAMWIEDTPPHDAPGVALTVPSSPYTPLSTIGPTSWIPIVQTTSLGAAFTATDLLGYHEYSGSVTWRDPPPTARASIDAVPDWTLSYAYARWRPVVWLTAQATTSFFAGQPTASGEPAPITERSRQLEAGVSIPISHARAAHVWRASFLRSVDEFTMPDRTASLDRAALRAAWGTATAHFFGYSISRERGIAAGATVEADRTALGSAADATMVTADLHAYAPLPLPHHVLAIRAAAGVATGNPNIRQTYHLGGPGPNIATTSFARDAISLMRGFPSDRFAGSHVALVNADYRFPIVRPQRGVETWPFFLHTIHGAVFADAGQIWTTDFSATPVKTSVGAELSADIVFGYFVPLTVSGGAAWGHAGRSGPRGTTFYVRVGRAF